MIGVTFSDLLLPLVICASLGGLVLTGGFVMYALARERANRPLLPWAARMRVERAKASLELDAIEIRRLAVDHHRTRVLQAIADDDHEAVQQLGLPAGDGKVEDGQWQHVR